MGDEQKEMTMEDIEAMTSEELDGLTEADKQKFKIDDDKLASLKVAADERAREAELENEDAEKKAASDAETDAETAAKEKQEKEDAKAKAGKEKQDKANAPKANTGVTDKVTEKVSKEAVKQLPKDTTKVVIAALRVLASKTLNQAEMSDFADSFPSLFE